MLDAVERHFRLHVLVLGIAVVRSKRYFGMQTSRYLPS